MNVSYPGSPDELSALLRDASSASRTVSLSGNASKTRAGGPIAPADVSISTAQMTRVLEYEPKDLTVSVEAGMRYARLREMLDRDGYMVPLDPPFAEQATIGGILAANSSGPRRRAYGSARDLVIGMRFATMEGKLVQSGGMVVKNVAGLDMAKMLIGSLGTLAAIATVNFKLIPKPAGTRTYLFEYPSIDGAIQLRDRLLQSVLHPAAVDLLNPGAAAMVNRKGWLLAVATQGNQAVLDRYSKELQGGEALDGAAESSFWNLLQEVTPRFLASWPEGSVVRSSVQLQSLREAMTRLPGSVVARAGNGVCYAHIESPAEAGQALSIGKAVMEFGPRNRDSALPMWPDPGTGFPLMRRIKDMFDPKHLLNCGRLYGRI